MLGQAVEVAVAEVVVVVVVVVVANLFDLSFVFSSKNSMDCYLLGQVYATVPISPLGFMPRTARQPLRGGVSLVDSIVTFLGFGLFAASRHAARWEWYSLAALAIQPTGFSTPPF